MLATLCLAALLAAPRAAQEPAAFSAGLEAYRGADYASAETLWSSLLEEELTSDERATLYYDLGNAAFRQGKSAEAVAWFTASLRLRPREHDTWANLELARADAGMEPADRGDLVDTAQRVLTAVTRAEAEWLALGATLLLAAALAGEALRGGPGWRRASLAALGLALLSLAPIAWDEVRAGRDEQLVVADSVPLRSEPRPELPAIGSLEGGAIVERIDALPLWVRVETAEDVRGWVPAGAVRSLAP